MNKLAKIFYYQNGSGDGKDGELLFDCIKERYDVIMQDCQNANEKKYENGRFLYDFKQPESIDLGIFNNVHGRPDHIKKKILILNEEWLYYNDLEDLKNSKNYYNYVVVKSEYSKKLLSPYHKNVIVLPFWSIDRYKPTKIKNETFHFAGRSIQKGTEMLVNDPDITVLDSTNRFAKFAKCNYINYYVSDEHLNEMLNSYNLHLCPSLYEGHGHYMYESLSCGKSILCSKIPVWEELIDPDMVNFINVKEVDFDDRFNYFKNKKDGAWPLRKGFIIDEDELKEKIQEHKKDKIDMKKREYCLDINKKRRAVFKKFLLDL